MIRGRPPDPANRKIPSLAKALWCALFAFVVATRLVFVFSPLEHIVAVFPDDAFYYFETAQRIVHGEGLTFDGEDLADGFQPLWMLVLLPFAWLPKLAFLKASIALATLFHLLAIVGLGRFVFLVFDPLGDQLGSQTGEQPGKPLGMQVGPHYAALLAGAIYATNKWAIFSSTNGLETALTSALFCTCLVIATRVALASASTARPNSKATAPNLWLIGTIVALLFLARTDQLFYATAFLLAMLLCVKNPLRWTVRVAMAGLSLALPWFLWHWWISGSAVPSSGRAQPLILQTLHSLHSLANLDQPAGPDQGWILFRGFFDGRVFSFTGFNRYLLIPLGGLGLGITGLRWPTFSATRRWAIGLMALLSLAGIALAFVHTYLRWYPRTWYFDQYIILVAAFLGVASVDVADSARALVQRFHFPRTLHLAAMGAAILLALVPLSRSAWNGWHGIHHGIYNHQVRNLRAAEWIKENAEGATIAGWNSGIIAFYLDQPVINLDGAMSASTLPYLEQRDLTALLCQRQVRYIADHPGEFERFQPFLPGFSSYTPLPASNPVSDDLPFALQEISPSLWANGCDD